MFEKWIGLLHRVSWFWWRPFKEATSLSVYHSAFQASTLEMGTNHLCIAIPLLGAKRRLPPQWFQLRVLRPPFLSYWIGLTCITNRIFWKRWCVTAEPRASEIPELLPCRLLNYLLGGSQLPCSKDTHTALERKATWQGAELSRQQPREWNILKADPPAPFNPSNDCSLDQQLDGNYRKDP